MHGHGAHEIPRDQHLDAEQQRAAETPPEGAERIRLARAQVAKIAHGGEQKSDYDDEDSGSLEQLTDDGNKRAPWSILPEPPCRKT